MYMFMGQHLGTIHTGHCYILDNESQKRMVLVHLSREVVLPAGLGMLHVLIQLIQYIVLLQDRY